MAATPPSMFKQRRARFLKEIGDGVAILPSAPVAIRSRDVEFVYHQDHDLYYLTGFAEPESVAVLAPGHPEGEFVMFVRPRDKERETWTGRRAGVEGAVADYGADRAYRIDELLDVLPRFLEKTSRIYYPLGRNEKLNNQVLELIRTAEANRQRTGSGPTALLDPRDILHEHRLFKDEVELAAMRRAISISAVAHRRAMESARDGMKEWEIEALLAYCFRSQGGSGPAYPSIVASGANATILHYVNNDDTLRGGELLLIDAGAEFDYYASDITRTFPIGSRFDGARRDLYEIVLQAQLDGIVTVRPGVSFDAPHDAALRTLVDGMRNVGLLSGSTDELISTGAYRRFYMHRTSHWLGMDVHDVGLYRLRGEARRLEPGMVLTVEPGIYISPDDDTAPASMRGIGIRVEDDVLVTADGHEVMSAGIPKHLPEIEALTAG
jgi:Xaa-Pro aminopeptidase